MLTVKSICLAILQMGDATGYEIRKRVAEGHFSHFVDASYGSIYPALNKLEEEGHLSAQVVEQEGKPNRRVYAITEAGRQAFVETLNQPARPDTFRSEFLFLAMFAPYVSPQHIEATLDAQIRWLIGELDLIDDAEASVGLEAAGWVAAYGRHCLQSQLDYLYENRPQLQAMAGTGLGKSDTSASPLVAAE